MTGSTCGKEDERGGEQIQGQAQPQDQPRGQKPQQDQELVPADVWVRIKLNENNLGDQVDSLLQDDDEEASLDLDKVLPGSTSQQQLYSQSVKPFVPVVLVGYDLCVLVYGQVGAGKTFSLIGPDIPPAAREEDFGIIPRFLRDVFGKAEASRSICWVEMSLTTIGNDNTVTDLLADGRTEEATVQNCRNIDEAFVCLRRGMLRLGQLSEDPVGRYLGYNRKLSPGFHTVVNLHVMCKKVDAQSGRWIQTKSVVKFVELAGSDLPSNTGLHWLHCVVNSDTPCSSDWHRLTSEIKSALGGSSLLLFLCCVSGLDKDREHTCTALHLAKRIKKFKNLPQCRYTDCAAPERDPRGSHPGEPVTSPSDKSSSIYLPPTPSSQLPNGHPLPYGQIPYHLNPEFLYNFQMHYLKEMSSLYHGGGVMPNVFPAHHLATRFAHPPFPHLPPPPAPSFPRLPAQDNYPGLCSTPAAQIQNNHNLSSVSSLTSSPLTSPLPMRPAFAPHLYLPGFTNAAATDNNAEDMARLPINASSRVNAGSEEEEEERGQGKRRPSVRSGKEAWDAKYKLGSILEESDTSRDGSGSVKGSHQSGSLNLDKDDAASKSDVGDDHSVSSEEIGGEDESIESEDDDEFDSECSNMSDVPPEGDAADSPAEPLSLSVDFAQFARDTDELVLAFEKGLELKQKECDKKVNENVVFKKASEEGKEGKASVPCDAELITKSGQSVEVDDRHRQFMHFCQELRDKLYRRRSELKQQDQHIRKAIRDFSQGVPDEKQLGRMRGLDEKEQRMIMEWLEEMLETDSESAYDNDLARRKRDKGANDNSVNKEQDQAWLVDVQRTCIANTGKVDSFINVCQTAQNLKFSQDSNLISGSCCSALAEQLKGFLENMTLSERDALLLSTIAQSAELHGQAQVAEDDIKEMDQTREKLEHVVKVLHGKCEKLKAQRQEARLAADRYRNKCESLKQRYEKRLEEHDFLKKFYRENCDSSGANPPVSHKPARHQRVHKQVAGAAGDGAGSNNAKVSLKEDKIVIRRWR